MIHICSHYIILLGAVAPLIHCWNYETIYEGAEPSRNRVIIPTHLATKAVDTRTNYKIKNTLYHLSFSNHGLIPWRKGNDFKCDHIIVNIRTRCVCVWTLASFSNVSTSALSINLFTVAAVDKSIPFLEGFH